MQGIHPVKMLEVSMLQADKSNNHMQKGAVKLMGKAKWCASVKLVATCSSSAHLICLTESLVDVVSG